MSLQLVDSLAELGTTAKPKSKADYQVLSVRKGLSGAVKLDQGDSARVAVSHIFGGEVVVVLPEGDHLAGIGRVGTPWVSLEADLQFPSAWAREHVSARVFSRGILTGSFLVKETLSSSAGQDNLSALPPDVVKFREKNGLGDHLRKAIELVKTTFAGYEKLEFEFHQDPESEDEWIVLRVVVRADRVNVSAARKKYTTAWVASVPSTHRSLIRLSPDIL